MPASSLSFPFVISCAGWGSSHVLCHTSHYRSLKHYWYVKDQFNLQLSELFTASRHQLCGGKSHVRVIDLDGFFLSILVLLKKTHKLCLLVSFCHDVPITIEMHTTCVISFKRQYLVKLDSEWGFSCLGMTSQWRSISKHEILIVSKRILKIYLKTWQSDCFEENGRSDSNRNHNHHNICCLLLDSLCVSFILKYCILFDNKKVWKKFSWHIK